MGKITLDPALRAKLNGLNETLEICDESGATVGHYLPESVYRHWLYRIAETQCPYSKEEPSEMRKQKGGRPLAEIWKSLGRTSAKSVER
jgi:hypothetical protein